MNDHFVKAREKGTKQFKFVTPKLGLTRLRVHAATFTKEGAERSVSEWAEQDKEYEFKAVKQ